jgi:hypothetical protein
VILSRSILSQVIGPVKNTWAWSDFTKLTTQLRTHRHRQPTPPPALIEGEGAPRSDREGCQDPTINGGWEGEREAKIWSGEPHTLPTELGRRCFTTRKNPQLAAPPIQSSPLRLFACEAYRCSASSGWVDEREKPTLGYETGDVVDRYWHELPVGPLFLLNSNWCNLFRVHVRVGWRQPKQLAIIMHPCIFFLASLIKRGSSIRVQLLSHIPLVVAANCS